MLDADLPGRIIIIDFVSSAPNLHKTEPDPDQTSGDHGVISSAEWTLFANFEIRTSCRSYRLCPQHCVPRFEILEFAGQSELHCYWVDERCQMDGFTHSLPTNTHTPECVVAHLSIVSHTHTCMWYARRSQTQRSKTKPPVETTRTPVVYVISQTANVDMNLARRLIHRDAHIAKCKHI